MHENRRLKKAARVSILDVARETGVALSTVSNALAGKDCVTEATRKRIEEAARRLGYRASGVARALRMQRTFTIGVLMADVSNPSSPDFVRGIEDVAEREKCSLLLCNTDDILEKQLAHMRVLLERQVDGLVLVSQYCDSPELRELLDSGTPFVLLQRRSPKYKDDYVGADNYDGITAAVKHLTGLGHRRIGFIRGPAASSTATERLEAFKRAVASFRIDRDPALIVQGNYLVEGGHQAAGQLLSLERRPTAIIAANDMCAMGVLNAAHERQLNVPKDLSVVGWDDIQFASFPFINLTTLQLPKRDMGAAAATLLMQRIRKKRTVTAKEVSFSTKLVARGSTGIAPAQYSNDRVTPAREARPATKVATVS